MVSEPRREYSLLFSPSLLVLIFEEERWYQKLLHNETAYQLQRKLQFAGLNAMVLPVRVLQSAT